MTSVIISFAIAASKDVKLVPCHRALKRLKSMLPAQIFHS